MKSLVKTAPIVTLVLLAACASPNSNLQTATGDTKPQPVVVQVPVLVSTPGLEAGCWAQLYSERNFAGGPATLVGPVSLETADQFSGKQLKRTIDSLVTGPKATLRVYEHAMFKDRSITFGPNSREGGLITKLGFGGEIQSLQLDCTN